MFTDKLLSNNLWQFLQRYDLTQLIVQPTRITTDSQSLIDIIATSHPGNYKSCGTIPCGISDRLLVYAEQEMCVTPSAVETITVRCYNKCNWQDFLEDVHWQRIEEHNDVDAAWNCWKTMFFEVLEKHAPVKTFRPWKSLTMDR